MDLIIIFAITQSEHNASALSGRQPHGCLNGAARVQPDAGSA